MPTSISQLSPFGAESEGNTDDRMGVPEIVDFEGRFGEKVSRYQELAGKLQGFDTAFRELVAESRLDENASYFEKKAAYIQEHSPTKASLYMEKARECARRATGIRADLEFRSMGDPKSTSTFFEAQGLFNDIEYRRQTGEETSNLALGVANTASNRARSIVDMPYHPPQSEPRL